MVLGIPTLTTADAPVITSSGALLSKPYRCCAVYLADSEKVKAGIVTAVLQMDAKFDVEIPMRDGVLLRADIYRPSNVPAAPVLLHRTPYGKQVPANVFNILDTFAAIRAGFIVVHQDTRGRDASDGEWIPLVHEREDGYDTVQWLASMPESSGAVGMFGASYTGYTQWAAAALNPPALKAIAPMVTWCEPMDGLLERGGAREWGLNNVWSLMMGIGQKVRESQRTGTPQVDAINEILDDYDTLARKGYWHLPSTETLAYNKHGLPDIGAYGLVPQADGSHCRVAGEHPGIDIPVLNIAGWYDLFIQGSIDNHLAMAATTGWSELIVGPWSHRSMQGVEAGFTGAVDFGLGASPTLIDRATSITEVQLAFFDRCLRPDARPSGVPTKPVTIFVMGSNEWRQEDKWPLDRAVQTPIYLGSEGLSWSAPDRRSETHFQDDPLLPVPTTGGPVELHLPFPAGPQPQTEIEKRDDVLVFTSEPLSEDIEITGRVTASLYCSSSKASADWVVRLCDVDTDGVSRNIVDGIVRSSATQRVDRIDVDLWSTSNVFKTGHRLRVQVTSTNFPRWDRNQAESMTAGTYTVYCGGETPSHLELPIVPS